MKKENNPFAPTPKPRTADDWRVAKDVARQALNWELARQWGLVGENGQVNKEAAEILLARAELGTGSKG